MTQTEISKRLGYSDQDILLIVHADDMGMCHSENRATIDAFQKGGINSSSIMITCPWAKEAIEFAKENPHFDIGLHLTFTCEWKNYKWNSISGKPELHDQSGFFFPKTHMVHEKASAQIVILEARAQIERVLNMGFQPSHLDSHMACLFDKEEVIDGMIELAEKYKIPFFLPLNLLDESLVSKYANHASTYAVPFEKGLFMDRGVAREDWESWYLNELSQLTPGLNTLLVHVGYNDSELQAVCIDHPDFGSTWRERDLKFLLGDAFQDFIKSEKIHLITWQEIQKVIDF